MRFYFSLYLLIAGIYLLTASGRMGLADSVAMYQVSESLLTRHSLSSDPCEPNLRELTTGASVGCVTGRDGRHYAGFGLLPSLAAVPVIAVADVTARLAHMDAIAVARLAVSLFTLLVAPLTCVVVAAWAVGLGYKLWTAGAIAVILALASPYWHLSVKGFLSEPYFTLALVGAGYLLSRARASDCLLAGFCFGAACAARLNGVILFPGFVLALTLHARQRGLSIRHFLRDCFAFGTPVVAVGLAIAWANYVRFGSPLRTGYHVAFPSTAALLSTPFFPGLFRILFSPDIGLLVFAPWLLISVACFALLLREHLPEALLGASITLTYVLFFAKFSHPEGGWLAGPRYLLPAIPFLALALAPVIEKLRRPECSTSTAWKAVGALLICLVSLGFVAQAVGAPFPDERYYALMEFYADKSAKPWWTGSIMLAALDFLPRMQMPERRNVLRGSSASLPDESPTAVPAPSGAVETETEHLLHMPNPVNVLSPNLLLAKFRTMGLPRSAVWAYFLASLGLGLAGVIGLRRSAIKQLIMEPAC